MHVHWGPPLDALLAETPEPVDVVLREPPSSIPLFLPGVAPHVVAVLLPEPGNVLVDQRETPYPLRALPEIQVRHQQPSGPAVLWREPLTVPARAAPPRPQTCCRVGSTA